MLLLNNINRVRITENVGLFKQAYTSLRTITNIAFGCINTLYCAIQ